jgi:pimeloyl-ACP methyl ester carboxylesterase
MPAFAIARPGVMGSTGFHVIGGVRKERQLIASAIDALERRYGVERLVLGGQSGAARIAAQLLTSGRGDIHCAAMASGAYGVPGRKGGGWMSTNIWGEPSKSYLIPLRMVPGVLHDVERRLFVIGDRRDKRTQFPEQRDWADALRRAVAPGGGKESHYLGEVAMRVGEMCARGESDGPIEAYAASLRRGAKRTLPTIK